MCPASCALGWNNKRCWERAERAREGSSPAELRAGALPLLVGGRRTFGKQRLLTWAALTESELQLWVGEWVGVRVLSVSWEPPHPAAALDPCHTRLLESPRTVSPTGLRLALPG